METTLATVQAVAEAGASVIEIGVPFSDPVADGPVIQAAFSDALDRGIRIDDMLASIRTLKLNVPLVAMLSFSIAYRRGVERFVGQLRDAGFAGLILPDLPLPEADEVVTLIQAAGLQTILLVAPGTTATRRQEIVRRCSGFVYQMAVAGVTGARSTMAETLDDQLAHVRAESSVPVAVGFGISERQHVARLAGKADAAIVGSAIVKRMGEVMPHGVDAVATAAATLCRELLA